MKEGIKDRLSRIMRDRNITHEQLAEMINEQPATPGYDGGPKATKSLISDIITIGKMPKTETVSKLARALNVSADYLLGLSDNPAPLDVKEASIEEAAQLTGLSFDTITEMVKLRDAVNEGKAKQAAAEARDHELFNSEREKQGIPATDKEYDNAHLHIMETIERLIHEEYVTLTPSEAKKKNNTFIMKHGSPLWALTRFFYRFNEYGHGKYQTKINLQSGLATTREDMVKLEILGVSHCLSSYISALKELYREAEKNDTKEAKAR